MRTKGHRRTNAHVVLRPISFGILATVGFGPEARMDRAIAEKLQAMADEAETIDQEYEFTRWSGRVHQFLSTAAGADEASHFDTLVSQFWPDTVAMRRG